MTPRTDPEPAGARRNDPPERRIKLRLHYDGVDFFGWQIQPGIRTVQSELESALSRLTDRPTSTLAAGRTDRGVHATGQVVSAVVPAKWTPQGLRRALNAILPIDIWVAEAEEVPLDFHARYDAVARGYVYRVDTTKSWRSPFHRRWCWPLGQELDPDALTEAAAALPGEHSFLAFAKAGQPERGELCTVYEARWLEWPGRGVAFQIMANRFLHYMVRYLVGTMVDAGRGRRPAQDVARLLARDPGLETSPPAPADGLFLTTIHYTADWAGQERIDEDLP